MKEPNGFHHCHCQKFATNSKDLKRKITFQNLQLEVNYKFYKPERGN